MGSPVSVVITEAALRDLEGKAMKHLQPRFGARYVDDTFVIIKREDRGWFFDVLNGVSAGIQFTMKEEEEEEEEEEEKEEEDQCLPCNKATGRPLTNGSDMNYNVKQSLKIVLGR